MAVWSQLMDVSIPYNCYEVIHTWEPDCNIVALDFGARAFYEALKLYAPVYLVAYLIKGKFSWKTTLQTVKNFLISSSFLGYYGFYLNIFYCLIRKLMGSYYNVVCSYFPAFIASLLCYFVERENRRRALTIYLANAATETALRMAISRGIIKSYPNSEVYLFGATMATYFYFVKRWGFPEDAVSGIIKFLFGKDEAKRKGENECQKILCNATDQVMLATKYSNGIPKFKDAIRTTYLKIFSFKHVSCNHASGCINYCLQGFLRPFLLGYLALSAKHFLPLRKKLIFSSSGLINFLIQKRNFNLGLFLGGFGGTFKVVSCTLRWYVGKDQAIFAIPAGFLGGLCMKFFPSSTLSLYLLWKLIELGYLSGIEAGFLPHVKGFLPLLFSASTALLFHTVALEPHNLKPSYFKFLKQMTNNRILLINRRVLNIFGTDASKLRPDFWPEMNHRYTSEKFKEIALLFLVP